MRFAWLGKGYGMWLDIRITRRWAYVQIGPLAWSIGR